MSGYEVETASSAANSIDKFATVSCDGDKIVIGGGHRITYSNSGDLGDVVVTESYPSAANEWTVTAHENNAVGNTETWQIHVYAICVNP